MRDDFSLKAYRADFLAPSGVPVAVDHFTARNTGQAVAFARMRAPRVSARFTVADATGATLHAARVA